MGRNAEKETVRIVATISTYLDRAAEDPLLPLTYEGIEKGTGVSRGHFSRRKDEPILALVRRIEQLKVGRRDGSAPGGAEASREPQQPVTNAIPAPMSGVLAVLPIEALEKAIQRDLRELMRLQAQWTARHARSEVQDAPLVLHDADELLRHLRASVERVRPAVTEWTRRQAAGEREVALRGWAVRAEPT